MATNSITGFTKSFVSNYLFGLLLSSATASTGTVEFSYDNDPTTVWRSIGSDDTTTETLTYVFSSAVAIDRIFALDMNWLDFDVQYWTGSVWADFTNVYSLASDTVAASSISYTNNTETSRYWEFDSVNTTQIRFQMTKTQTADQEKEVQEIYIGQEIGTFVDDIFGKPNRVKITFEDGEKQLKLSNQGVRQIIRGKKLRAKLNLKQLWETNDQDIVASMYANREVTISFCGADGTLYTKEGFRLQDLYTCVISRPLNADHSMGRDKDLGYTYKFELKEI